MRDRRAAVGSPVFALLVVLGAVLGAAPAQGQDDAVTSVAHALAAAWKVGDAPALERFLPPEGIDLSLDGATHRGVGRRQARAALARFLEPWTEGGVVVQRAESLGGEPPRALVELLWTARTADTPEARTFVIFVSLERIDDDWCIQEIRLFS